MGGQTVGERMASIEEWVSGHEALCAERYGGLKSDLRWLIRGVFGMLVGIVAWLAVQLWNGRAAGEHPAPPAAMVQSQPPGSAPPAA